MSPLDREDRTMFPFYVRCDKCGFWYMSEPTICVLREPGDVCGDRSTSSGAKACDGICRETGRREAGKVVPIK